MPHPQRTISFFICSCYRDMHAERAYLHEVVHPLVNPMFQERGLRLEFLDPRRQARSEEHAEGAASLSQSLAFIDRARPCFLGIFGANYGKVIPRIPEQIGAHYPEIQFYARCSRVHLETLYAVLQDPRQAEHSYFYFRQPDFMEDMSPRDRLLLESSNPSPAQRGVESFKLRMLREAIERSGRPVTEYGCQWDASTRSITHLETFGERVTTDLLNLLSSLSPRPVQSVPSFLLPPAAAVPVTPFAEVVAHAEEPGIDLGAQERPPGAAETLRGEEEPMLVEVEGVVDEGEATLRFPGEPIAADAVGGMESAGQSAILHFSDQEMQAHPDDGQPLKIFSEDGETDAEPVFDPSAFEPDVAAFAPTPAAVPLRQPIGEQQAPRSDILHAINEAPTSSVGANLFEPPDTAAPMSADGVRHPAQVIAECTAILSDDGNDLEAYRQRAAAHRQLQDYGEALADYAEITRLAPDDPQAYNDQAWIWATCPNFQFRDGARAVESAQRAVELDGSGDALVFDNNGSSKGTGSVAFKETLAAAHAENGDFESAVATLDEALAVADKSDQPRLFLRRKLFQSKHPYRDEPGGDEPGLYTDAASAEDDGLDALDEALEEGGGAELAAQRRALLQKIGANPDDHSPLLAYAHWLSKLGNPLAEFIRVDLELERMADNDARRPGMERRWSELLDKHGREWVQPLKPLGLEPLIFGEFAPTLWLNHGVIESVTIDNLGILPERADELFEGAPALRKLQFEGCRPDLPALARLPQMAQITGLTLASLGLMLDDIRALVGSHHFAGLTELDLSDNLLGIAGAQALAAALHLRQLTRLELRGCALGSDGAAALAGSGILSSVERLILPGNNIGSKGAKALAESPHVARVEHLELNDNHEQPIGAEGIAALGKSPYLANLRTLNLASNAFSDEGAQALAAATELKHLETLDLSGTEITARGLQALVTSAVVERLHTLNLTGNEECTALAARVLASSPRLDGLKELQLTQCGICDPGITAIAASPHLSNLVELGVAGCGITAEGAQAIANSETLANLHELDLRDNELGAEGIQALLDSPHLAKIERLLLSGTGFTAEQEAALADRFGDNAILN
jgi:uncharacterized protein (TIGR02996 family)